MSNEIKTRPLTPTEQKYTYAQSMQLTLQAVLLQLQGFSIAEIALMLDMKEYTVYKRLSRLKEKIKKLLG